MWFISYLHSLKRQYNSMSQKHCPLVAVEIWFVTYPPPPQSNVDQPEDIHTARPGVSWSKEEVSKSPGGPDG